MINLDEDDRLITIRDARTYFKHCVPGWIAFIESHGLDWKECVRNGVRASTLIKTDDAMAIALVEFVYQDTYVK
jgi:hypothetical protein